MHVHITWQDMHAGMKEGYTHESAEHDDRMKRGTGILALILC